MTKLLLKLFIRDYQNTEDSKVRGAYGILAGIVGIVCNLFLCIAKIILGVISKSVSITADAVNNLSDASSSVVTIIGFLLAKKPADKEHPYGHARFEYLSGLLVAAMIIVFGVFLGKSSVEKMIRPETVVFSTATIVILVGSILVKLWMSLFQSQLGKRINSKSLMATSADSRNDVISTAAVLLGAVVSEFTGLSLDGYFGFAVAVFIVYSGISMGKETISPLLGESADEELVMMIRDGILGYNKKVLGIHDLMVHDYGPGQCFASVHLEMDAKEDVLEAHEIIDEIEKLFAERYRIQLVIHYDPIVTDDEELNEMKEYICVVLKEREEGLKVHDFRMLRGKNQTKLIFDLVIPERFKNRQTEIKSFLDEMVQKKDKKYETVITFDGESFNRM